MRVFCLGPSRRPKADPAKVKKVGAPMRGLAVKLSVRPGDTVAKGQKHLTMEAMKMEAMPALAAGLAVHRWSMLEFLTKLQYASRMQPDN